MHRRQPKQPRRLIWTSCAVMTLSIMIYRQELRYVHNEGHHHRRRSVLDPLTRALDPPSSPPTEATPRLYNRPHISTNINPLAKHAPRVTARDPRRLSS
jgi:hypothetical protein